MSHAVVCDHCGSTLKLNRADGDDEYGERSGAWIQMRVASDDFEVCSLACAHEFLERPAVRAGIEAHLEAVAEIARAIREADGKAE